MKNLCRKCTYCITEDNSLFTQRITCEKFDCAVAPKHKCRYFTSEKDKKIYERLKAQEK